MYLETIQRLSMYIVRAQKDGQATQLDVTTTAAESAGQAALDQETARNIRCLMDENVFDLLDKTERKVLQLQRENVDLIEELTRSYEEAMTKEEQVSVIYDLLFQMQRVIDELIPEDASSYSRDSVVTPLTSRNLKHNLPESVLNILNKVYSRRLDFEKQRKKFS